MQPAYQPIIRQEAKEYWDGLRRSELLIQRCVLCERYVFYPREHCPHDMGELIYEKVSGKGRVLSFTVVEKYPDPVFQHHLPMIVAIIQLDEGPLMMSRIINIELAELAFNQEVQVRFIPISEEITLPFFSPIKSNNGDKHV